MTDKDKEKVLHGLNSCGFCDGIPNICEVTECPYREHKVWCVHELAHDASLLISELLKEQEPRVMTLEEAEQLEYKDVVWVECREKYSLYGECEDYYVEHDISPAIFVGRSGMLGFITSSILTNGQAENMLYADVSDRDSDGMKKLHNRTWRIWNTKPNDVQMKEAEWDEDWSHYRVFEN